MNDISVVIVSFNTKALLGACLKSLFAQAGRLTMEVVVIDNASTDGSIEMMTKEFPQVTLIVNRENVGFAKANNQALRQVTGRYLLLLNSDTVVLDQAVLKMVNWMDAHPKTGIATCQLLNKDGSIQPSGGYFPTLDRVLAWMVFLDDLPFIGPKLTSFHPHPPQFLGAGSFYTKEHYQDWVTGAFLLMRRDVFSEVGLLDEAFFMYVEEMEYCYRAKKAGFAVAYVPSAHIIHYGGASSGQASKVSILGEYRGLAYFYQKHFSPLHQSLLWFLLKLGAFLRLVIFGILMARSQEREAYAQALRS